MKYLKHEIVYLYGDHTFTVGDWSWTPTTETFLLTPSKGEEEGSGGEAIGGIIDELRDDLLPEALELLRSWLTQQLGGSSQ